MAVAGGDQRYWCRGLGYGRHRPFSAGHVAGNAETADLCGGLPRGVAINIEDRDFSAEGSKAFGGGASKARAAAGYKRRVSVGMQGDQSETQTSRR